MDALHFHLLSPPLGNNVPENRVVKWSVLARGIFLPLVLGSFLGGSPPGHHFVTFLLTRDPPDLEFPGRFDGYEFSSLFPDSTGRHLFAFAISYCPLFGPTRNLKCTVLGDQFQASFASVPVLLWTKNVGRRQSYGSFYGKVPCLSVSE